VFIPGCENGLIPLKFGSQDFDMDEERRLLYVGMTRSQSQLYLIHAKSRLVFGQKTKQQPSPFLASISESLTKHGEQSFAKGKSANQLKLF
jgi:DNA helicase II / ATP-dependent DNA helicase PcrA